MKRYFPLLLCLALCCALFACGNPAPTPTTTTTQMPIETEAPTTTETATTTQAPETTERPSPPTGLEYIPGSVKLDDQIGGDFSFTPTKRGIYYNIVGPLSELAPEGTLDELFEKDKDVYTEPQEMVLVTLVKYCNISRQDFDKTVEKYIEWCIAVGGDISEEQFEAPNADVIYTFDNDIINEYYRRQ